MADQAIGTATRERDGRQWLRVLVVGLLLWVASVAVTFWTGNTNLVPTVILLGSFLVPVAFASYAFGRADQVVTPQRIFAAFVYGGVLGVLGASVLAGGFLQQPSAWGSPPRRAPGTRSTRCSPWRVVAAEPGRDRGPARVADPARPRAVDRHPGRGAVPHRRRGRPAAAVGRPGRLVPAGGVAARVVDASRPVAVG